MITHDFKLIFIHIPKCCGRSICNLFNQRFDHFTAHYYKTEFENYWKDYTKFTIVRNPYDRLVSMYHYIKQHRRHSQEEIATYGKMPGFKQWLIENIKLYRGDFIWNSPEGKRGTDGLIGSSFWFSSQFSRVLYVDEMYIFKFEDLKLLDDFLTLKLSKPITLPHENGSNHANYLEHYDDELFSIVNSFPPVLRDLKIFNYEIKK